MNIIEKKKRQMGQGGFTLIELLVVIAILAVLAGLAVIGIGAMRDNANKQACKADVDTYQTAVEAWRVDNPNGSATVSDITGGTSPLVKRASKYSMAISGNTVSSTACP